MGLQDEDVSLDALIIGAGFSGIYMLRKLRDELGLNARVFDKAGGIGGTWYWNKYPGALSDSRSHLYCYSFDDDLLNEWEWKNRYSSRPEILEYLEHVVDRFDLRRDMTLGVAIESAVFDESDGRWRVVTADGEVFRVKYLLSTMGILNAAVMPNIEGIDSFAGVSCHTSQWPEDLDVTGKRVGVIGSGSTGTQVVAALAPVVEHLTAFVRTPQYAVPIGNQPLTEDERRHLRENARAIWDDIYASMSAYGITPEPPPTAALEVSEEERTRVYQRAWDTAGPNAGPFHVFTGTFNDVMFSPEANETMAEFVRGKIREIVKDPETARKLTPNDLWARRPVADDGYLESFNRDNVSLVATKEQPIARIVPEGVLLEDGTTVELDVIVYATGFDGFSGPFRSMELRGRGGVRLDERWENKVSTLSGVAVSGYPNMFIVPGPFCPFANNPPMISSLGDFVGELIAHAERIGARTVEADAAAEAAYVEECEAIARQTVFFGVDSWLTGTNVEGKPRQVLMNLKGLAAYRQEAAQQAKDGFGQFHFDSGDGTSQARDRQEVSA